MKLLQPASAQRIRTRLDALRIKRNIIWRVDRSGIMAQSYQAKDTGWFPSTHVVVRDTWLGDNRRRRHHALGDRPLSGGANIVQGSNQRAGAYNAGIWPSIGNCKGSGVKKVAACCARWYFQAQCWMNCQTNDAGWDSVTQLRDATIGHRK